MDPFAIGRAALGFALMAFIPGFAWTWLLLPRLTRIERVVVAIALSIALMTLALYVGNVALGIPISAAAATYYAIGLTLAALGPIIMRRVGIRLKERLG